MYSRVNEYVSFCLKNELLRCSIKTGFSRLFKVIFILFSVTIFYLLVFDTSYIVNIGLYDNEIVKVMVCITSVIVGIILFLASHWYDFAAKNYIWNKFNNDALKRIDFIFTTRLVLLRVLVFLLKKMITFLFALPACFSIAMLYVNFDSGIDKKVLPVVISGSAVLLFIGISASLKLNKRYFLAEYYLYHGFSIKDSLKKSIYNMDNKCKKLCNYKCKNAFYRYLGVLFPHLSVIAYAREFVFVTDKTIEYAFKKHTQQKTIVFYCVKTIA